MRKAILAVTVIFALQGIPSNALALDPAADMQAANMAVTSAALDKPRVRLDEMQVQTADAQVQEMIARERQVARDFAKSKPVRIYFFFGGR